MKHKFEKLAQDGITLTEILQSRLNEIEAKINSDFPLISNLKDKNKNFLSTLYHIAQKSSTDDLAPEMIQFNIIGVVLERANIVGDEVSQEGLSGKELQNPDLIKEAISLSKFIEKDFGFELGVDKDGFVTESDLDKSDGVTPINVAFTLPIDSSSCPDELKNPFNEIFPQDYFSAAVKNDIKIIFDSLVGIVERTTQFKENPDSIDLDPLGMLSNFWWFLKIINLIL